MLEIVEHESAASNHRVPAPSVHRPTRSSPLSTQPLNIFGLSFEHSCTSTGSSNHHDTLPSPPDSPPSLVPPKRVFRPLPFTRGPEEGRNSRRTLFLKKIKNGREDRLYNRRGGGEDEMMRMIFVAEQKRWEASQASAAARIPTIYEEDEESAQDQNHGYECTGDDLEHFVREYERDQSFLRLTEKGKPSKKNYDIEEVMDREGRELEELLAQMDLRINHPTG